MSSMTTLPSLDSNGSLAGSGNIKVVVRCRPMNARELARGAQPLIRMSDAGQTYLDPPALMQGQAKGREKRGHAFTFDRAYQSALPKDDPGYASQRIIYEDLGVDLLDHSFNGYNTCIFAYGQTGSGKSYSMMGFGADKGIIPLTTEELFRRVQAKRQSDDDASFQIEVSYIEIYNEKVRDLLNPKNTAPLKVREHPSLGPYVEDLSRLVVEGNDEMMTLMDEGNKARTIAATNMNETSSRSHAIFTVILTQRRRDTATNMEGEKVSRISLVDLAGSERAASTGATGSRLKEGANINRSLTTLGKVIQVLAAASTDVSSRKKKEDFVPYRDSTLTWLLKESLGGNSRTCMIATISPADYEETLSTLRYADQAKRIKTSAVVNEDPNAKLIRELREEVELLRARSGLGISGGSFDSSVPADQQVVTYQTKDGQLKTVTKLELQENLEASEKLMATLNESWEDKMLKTAQIHLARDQALEDLGITVDKDLIGVHAPRRHPHLVNLNEDPMASECLVYQLKPGQTSVGSLESDANIKLSGQQISAVLCWFTNQAGKVSVAAGAPNAWVLVNGTRIGRSQPVELKAKDRVIIDFHIFRFASPDRTRSNRLSAPELTESSRPATPEDEGSIIDWNFARHEAALALRGTEFEQLNDDDLEELFKDIVKVKTSRHSLGLSRSASIPSGSQLAWTPATPTQAHSLPGVESSASDRNDVEGQSAQVRASVILSDLPGPDSGDHSPSKDSSLAQDWNTVERDMLAKQIREMTSDVAKLRHQARQSSMARIPLASDALTGRERRLARGCVNIWRKHRRKHLLREIRSLAAPLAEANASASSQGLLISYDWAIWEGNVPRPSLDNEDLLERLKGNDNGTASTGSAVWIRAFEHSSGDESYWTRHTFDRRLRSMRIVGTCRPSTPGTVITSHFRSSDIFGCSEPERPIPFAFALVKLAPLAAGKMLLVGADIYDASSFKPSGTCHIHLQPFSEKSSETFARRRLRLQLRVDKVAWVGKIKRVCYAEADPKTLFGLSAQGASLVSASTALAPSSDHFSGTKAIYACDMEYSLLQHLRSGYGRINFFRDPIPSLEYPKSPPRDCTADSDIISKITSSAMAATATPNHMLVVQVEILELAATGQYVVANARHRSGRDDPVFQLHQGCQRRLRLRIHHDSPNELSLQPLCKVTLGPVSIDGETTAAKTSRGRLVSLDFTGDLAVSTTLTGGEALLGETSWDSSMHRSACIDRTSAYGEVLRVTLQAEITLRSRAPPVSFNKDILLHVLDRSAISSLGYLDVFRDVRLVSCTSWPFCLTTQPQRSSDRLVQADQRYSNWLLARAIAYRRADVASTRDFLRGVRLPINVVASGENQALLRRVLALWQEPTKNQDAPLPVEGFEPFEPAKLVPSAQLGKPAKIGPLRIISPEHDGQWRTVWAVLRRPYLRLYETSKDTTELCTLWLEDARILQEMHIAELLQEPNCFTVYTLHNSTVFAAESGPATAAWVAALSAR